jgi:hypothetical protein
MTDYKATPEQWAQVEAWMAIESKYSACVLELRARIEALEDNSKPTPNSSQIGSSLVERVRNAIASEYDPKDYCWDEARAAIREVAAWLRKQKAVDLPDHTQWTAARAAELLEQETER